MLVAYFGVWQGYRTVAAAFGPAWGLAAAALTMAGLAVIAIVGAVVVRTLRTMEPTSRKRPGKGGKSAGLSRTRL